MSNILEPLNDWISVKKCIPNNRVTVLIRFIHPKTKEVSIRIDRRWDRKWDWNLSKCITHWKPIEWIDV